MNLIIHILMLCLVFFCNTTSAKYDEIPSYPIDFSEFFIKKTGEVNLVVAGERQDVKVVSTYNYDNINVSADYETLQIMRDYLGKYLNKKEIEIVINDLTRGVDANPGCTTIISDCVPHVLHNQVMYSFDFDTNTLKVFLGSSLISKSSNKEYLPYLRKNNGLVNNSTLYTQFSNENSAVFNFSNKTTIGTPVGFIELDTQARNSGDDFDVYSAVFDTEFGDKRIVLGYLNNTGRSFNTTDILNNNADYSAFNIQFGSSSNLLKGGSKGSQHLFFIAPQDGQLELYLGNRLLFSKSVSSGRQSISYSELPQGAYTINLKLSSGGIVLIDDMIQVVNNNSFTLAAGDVDYAFNAGVFDKKNNAQNIYYAENDLNRTYLQAKSSWRLAEPIILSGGITTNADDYYTQFGTKYIYDDSFSADYFFGYFSTGDYYHSANINFGRLSLAMKALDVNDKNKDFTLSNQLYGKNSYENFSIIYSKSLLGGNGYLNYNHYSRKYLNTTSNNNTFTSENVIDFSNNGSVVSNNQDSTIGSDNFNIGWSTSIYNGTLTLNSSYISNINSYNSDLKFGIYWSQRLGRSVTGGLSIFANDKGFSQYNNSLSSRTSNDNWNANYTAMASLLDNDNIDSSLSGTYNWQNDKANVNAYTFINNNGLLMSSGTLQSTQLLTPSSVSLTKHAGNAFADVNFESDTPISKIRYNLFSELYPKSGYISDVDNTILNILKTYLKNVNTINLIG